MRALVDTNVLVSALLTPDGAPSRVLAAARAERVEMVDDDHLVALARAAAVDVLVSGDRDLTELALPDVIVVTPRQLLARLQ